MSELVARALAGATRQKLNLSSIEPIDPIKAIVVLNITCVKRPLESDVSGATFKANDVKVILVNSAKTVGHQNFTIAHELYHCLYDDGLENSTCKVEVFPRKDTNERLADLFALHLLMPEEGILRQLQTRGKIGSGISITDILFLEQFFGVSRKAICRRLIEMKLIPDNKLDEYCKNIIRSAIIYGKDTSLYKPDNESRIISEYAEKAKEALDKGLITPAKYEEILADADLFETIQPKEIPDIVD